MKTYIDNNNFIRINTISIDRNLFNYFAQPLLDRFINIKTDPVWSGKSYFLNGFFSYDNGATEKEEVQ